MWAFGLWSYLWDDNDSPFCYTYGLTWLAEWVLWAIVYKISLAKKTDPV